MNSLSQRPTNWPEAFLRRRPWLTFSQSLSPRLAFFGFAIATILGQTPLSGADSVPEFQLLDDWRIEVQIPAPEDASPLGGIVKVEPAPVIAVQDEPYEALPVFNPRAGGWVKGAALRAIRAQECTTRYLLDPESLIVRAMWDGQWQTCQIDRDYAADLEWGTFGRLKGGRLSPEQVVMVSYRHGLLRLDSIVLRPDGRTIGLRQGRPRPAAPQPPELAVGEQRLANVWLPGRISQLKPEHLFPITETVYPEPPSPSPALAERFLPMTLAKLRSGQPLRVLAWGDSVTVGAYLPNPEKDRWQNQFVRRLQMKFPQAKITLLTEAWGGRNTGSYLNEPPGSAHNYREKVLQAKPDLIISEFVNDAGLDPNQVESRYGQFLQDFREIGAEWIILTPHYVRPDWMGLTQERDIDDDPRPYVHGLRQFTDRHGVALADASRRYGRLWRQGIPYSTLMLNSINHPDARGLRIFADSLMALF